MFTRLWRSVSFRIALIAVVPVALFCAFMFISSNRTTAMVKKSLAATEARENSQLALQQELLNIQAQSKLLVRVSGGNQVWIGNILISAERASAGDISAHRKALADQTKKLALALKAFESNVQTSPVSAQEATEGQNKYKSISHRAKLVLRLSRNLEYLQERTAKANERTLGLVAAGEMSGAISNYRYESQPLSRRLDSSLIRTNKILGGLTSDIQNSLKGLADEAQEATAKHLEAQLSSDRSVALVFALLVALIGIVYGVLGLSRPLRMLASAMRSAADGSCDPDIPDYEGGELGDMTRALRTFVQLHVNQRTLAAKIRATSETLLSSMSEIRESNGALANRTQEQAAATETFAATLSSMKKTVDSTANLSEDSGRLASATSNSGTESIEMAQNAVLAMQKIRSSSEKINTIVSTVQELAFMTQLLSLNAAVEAARAGKHGKGFAVVAEEVSSLALRSSAAATEITDLVESSVSQISQGAELVEESERLQQSIVRDLQSLGEASEEVRLGAQQQADQVTDLVQSITQIDASTRQNTAFVETLFATTAELEQGMAQLRSALDELV